MNRAGQPPQRPPSLGPNPALGGPFRPPYPAYGMPPRNVMPGYPALPNHRATQNIVPQPSPNYIQQRGQSGFPFGGGLQQQQQQQVTAQQAAQPPLSHTPHPQTQGQPATATTPGLPPHLTQTQTASSLATAPSVSSASEVGLDPNDFPALGATPTSLNTPSTTNATSYASQAGTGAGVVGNGASGNIGAQRDFTADDFPALGGSQATQQTSSQAPQNADNHPPGLNGFQQNNDQPHRQNLLGSLTGGGQQQPGLLNLGQARNNGQTAFQSEAEKRNYALKLNNQSSLAAAAAAWDSPTSNANQQPAAFPPSQNGARSNHIQSTQPPSTQPQTQTQHLVAPPGVPPPVTFVQQQQPQQPQPPVQPGVPQHTPYVGNGTVTGETPLHQSQSSAQLSGGTVPQTPAQQVLMSPADRWGLLGLLAMIKGADLDTSLLSVGTDLGTMGLDMQNHGLYSTFITPWADSSAAHTVEPDFHLPTCYNVAPPPPGPGKASVFSDETLFFMFYSSPRDALQEVAAQELFNRNWRYHKELRLWITKETGAPSSAKIPGGEQGTYSYWDPEDWTRARKEMTVLYSDLEDKHTPVFGPGQTLQLAQPQSAQGQPQQPQQPQQQQQQQQMVAGGRVAAFQNLGVAAM